MSNQIVEIERPALWRPIRNPKLSTRIYRGGFPYQTRSNIVSASSIVEPVVRYAKNYTKDGMQFGIFMFSLETDMQKAEDFMDSLAKEISKKEISDTLQSADMRNFKYLETYYSKEPIKNKKEKK